MVLMILVCGSLCFRVVSSLFREWFGFWTTVGKAVDLAVSKAQVPLSNLLLYAPSSDSFIFNCYSYFCVPAFSFLISAT